MSDRAVREFAGGDIALWLGEGGAVMLKVRRCRYNDPIELSEDKALELASELMRLSKEA